MGKIRLIIISAVLALLTLSTIIAALFLIPVGNYTYESVLNDKYDLLMNTASPKIVIVGGSSTALGVDSGMIEKEFDYRVVNIAVVGALTLRHSLEFAKSNLNEGDIVIVIPEYVHLYGIVNKKHFSKALVEFPRSIRHISPLEDPISISEILLNIQRRAQVFLGLRKPNRNITYNRVSFNKYGDMTGHLKEANRKNKIEPLYYNYHVVDNNALKVLNDFHDYSEKKGVETFMTFSPHISSEQSDYSDIQKWLDNLKEQLSIMIISNPENYLYPTDYFWDSADHLNAQGREIRTKQLVEDLKPFIKKNRN